MQISDTTYVSPLMRNLRAWAVCALMIGQFGCGAANGDAGGSSGPLGLSVLTVVLGSDGLTAPARPGRLLARLEVELENRSLDPLPIGFTHFTVATDTGLLIGGSAISELLDVPCSADLALAASASHVCNVAFEVPDSELPALLEYSDGMDITAEATVEVCEPQTPDVCGTACVSLVTDPENCGACGHAVELAGGECRGGIATCPEGTEECDGVCADLATDLAHCGVCNRAVAPDETCVDGQPACASDRLRCGTQCIDPQTDPAHCGACGQVVGDDQACIGGAPVCMDPSAIECDDNPCVDASSDPSHCGGCGSVCPSGGECWSAYYCTLQIFEDALTTCALACESRGYDCEDAVLCATPDPRGGVGGVGGPGPDPCAWEPYECGFGDYNKYCFCETSP